jgi:hypothetical protein
MRETSEPAGRPAPDLVPCSCDGTGPDLYKSTTRLTWSSRALPFHSCARQTHPFYKYDVCGTPGCGLDAVAPGTVVEVDTSSPSRGRGRARTPTTVSLLSASYISFLPLAGILYGTGTSLFVAVAHAN